MCVQINGQEIFHTSLPVMFLDDSFSFIGTVLLSTSHFILVKMSGIVTKKVLAIILHIDQL